MPVCASHLSDVQIATQLEDLAAARDQWRELWSVCPGATPFQSPDWLIPWWRHIGEGQLLAIMVWAGEELVGAAPFYIYQSVPAKARQCLLLGSGNSDYLGIVAKPGYEQQVNERIAASLREKSNGFDFLDLQELTHGAWPDGAHIPWLRINRRTEQSICLVLDISAGALDDIVPAQMAKQYRYARRRTARDFEFEIVAASPDTLSQHLDTLFDLHGRRWRSQGQTGVLADESMEKFHREASENFCAGGLLRLYTLQLNGRPAASLYGFAHNQKTYFYLGGMNPDFAKHSPGMILVGHAIETAIAEGHREFDFLRGQEDYKYKWGARERSNVSLKLTPSGSTHQTEGKQ